MFLSFSLQQCQKEHSGGRVQLRDILSVPVQRILKYHLLLGKLVDETSPVSIIDFGFVVLLYFNIFPYWQTHEDYRGLERAKEAMVDVAQFINEVKRDSEHLVVIQKVRVSCATNILSMNRIYRYQSTGKYHWSESTERKRFNTIRPITARRWFKHKSARRSKDETSLRIYFWEIVDSGENVQHKNWGAYFIIFLFECS